MKQSILPLLISLFLSPWATGQSPQEIQLPQPQKTGGMPLMEAFQNRHSQRSFSEQELPLQTLSNLLWAAYGVNREGGKRTVPSAMGWNEFDIYLIKPGEWEIYHPLNHTLQKGGNEDLRQWACTQEYGQTAPLNLVFVADFSRMENADEEEKNLYSAMDVGFISQNVYLFCASQGLATVVRASVDRTTLREKLNLKPHQHILLGQTVGYPKNQ